MKLSVIVPVYNEEATIREIIERIVQVEIEKEVIVVDDCSRDRTRDILKELSARYPGMLNCFYHERNRGKGGAIQTALSAVSGDVIVIQDADLEYHPEDYPAAFRLIASGWADAVYGSRFIGPHRVFMFAHLLANQFLTLLSNILTTGTLSDMETGFKMLRADVLKKLEIRSFTFDFEVEVTVKLFRYGYRVYEIPITYTGRGYEEGKKITWKDGVRALWALLKWGLIVRKKPA